MDANLIIELLDLQPHPEGGHFRQTWREPQGTGSAIYFFLQAGERSAWHRFPQYEIWHYYAGDAIRLSVSEDGMAVAEATLGPDLAAGQRPQLLVPAGAWQSAEPLGPWGLVGCTVSPAFDFATFQLAPPGWEPGSDTTGHTRSRD
jgi:predicted cupin superfamily sugar epimerase